MTCHYCGKNLDTTASGRTRKWCNDVCRKRAARAGTGPASIDLDAPLGEVGEAVAKLAGELDAPPDDPTTAMLVLARQMAAAVDARPGDVPLTRELRMILTTLAARPPHTEGTIDEATADFHRRRVLALLGRGGGE